MRLNLTVLNRSDLTIKENGEAQCYDWTINRDYLTNEKSQFFPKDKINFSVGDFIIAKIESGKYAKTRDNPQSVSPLYFGVIESSEVDTVQAINARDFYNIVNYDFTATSMSGNNLQAHLQTLLTRYLVNDASKLAENIEIITAGAPIAWTYQPNDPPTATNLNSYLINVFKKYSVTWEATDIYYDSENKIHIRTVIRPKTNSMNIKNNIFTLANWSVYYAPANLGAANKLEIIDKSVISASNMENLPVRSVWYLQKDGTITQSYSDNVFIPTISKVAIRDDTQTDPPTDLELAQSSLAGTAYAHEINFDANLDSKIIKVQDLELGTKTNIMVGTDLYPSVLTGYKMSSSSKWVSLKFGNIRSTLQSVVDSL